MGIADMFAGMDRADLNGKGQFIQCDGKFLVALKMIKFKPEGFNGKSFIVEYEIVESSRPDLHEPGVTRSWVLKWDKPQAKGDAKALMLAILGFDPKNVPAAAQAAQLHSDAATLAMAVCDPAYLETAGGNVLASASDAEHKVTVRDLVDNLDGFPLRLNTVMTKTRKGTDFTIHNWSPAPADTP